jgi:BlaI family transcriptional regulator, penicillinase repressor
MEKPKRIKPTDGELEILRILWTQGPCTVRQVNDLLGQHRDVGYTTTLKLMQIMFEKGILTRTKSGKTHTYIAQVSEQEVQQDLVDKLLDAAFEGSAMKLVLQALGNHQSSAAELDEIRSFLDELEKKGGHS